MLYRVVSGIGRGMGILDRGGDRRRGRAVWGKCGASHCNQRGLCGIQGGPKNKPLRLKAHIFCLDLQNA